MELFEKATCPHLACIYCLRHPRTPHRRSILRCTSASFNVCRPPRRLCCANPSTQGVHLRLSLPDQSVSRCHQWIHLVSRLRVLVLHRRRNLAYNRHSSPEQSGCHHLHGILDRQYCLPDRRLDTRWQCARTRSWSASVLGSAPSALPLWNGLLPISASHPTQWLACGSLHAGPNLRVLDLYRLDDSFPICGRIPPLLVCLLPLHSTAPGRALRRFLLRNLPLRLPHRADANATLWRTAAAGASLSLRHSADTSLRSSKLVRSGAALPSARETKGNRGSHDS